MAKKPKIVKRRILVRESKYGSTYYDASDENKEAGAFLSIFQANLEFHDYADLDDIDENRPKQPEGHVEGCRCDDCSLFQEEQKTWPGEQAELRQQRQWRDEAKKGNALLARKLIEKRNKYEYEQVNEEWLEIREAAYPPDEMQWGVKTPCVKTLITKQGFLRDFRHGQFSTHASDYGTAKKAEDAYSKQEGFGRHGPIRKLEVEPYKEVWSVIPEHPESLRKHDKFDGEVEIVAVYEQKCCGYHHTQLTRFDPKY